MKSISILTGISKGIKNNGELRINWSAHSSAMTANGEGLKKTWWCLCWNGDCVSDFCFYSAIEESISPVSKSGNLRGQAYGKKIRKSPIPTIPQKLSWCDMTMSSHPIHKRFDLNWCWQSTMTKKGILPNKPFLSAFAWFHRGPFQLVDKQGWTCTSTCHR